MRQAKTGFSIDLKGDQHVGKKGKASGIDGVRAEDILAEENGVEKFLAALHEELKTKSYRPSPVKRVCIPKAARCSLLYWFEFSSSLV